MSDENFALIGYHYINDTDPLQEAFDDYDVDPSLKILDEVSYQERAKKEILSLEVLDVEKYIKVNNLKEITNPTFFNASGAPTSDGLLSNEIFGITQKDRAGTFAYISLGEYFIDPSCYKTLIRLDNKFSFITNGLRISLLIEKEILKKILLDRLVSSGLKKTSERSSSSLQILVLET